ncbi:MAG: hypothetical protein M0Q44_06740 [Methylobacter sp.]|nr:hypothetical protein [Methylobacter sp.]
MKTVIQRAANLRNIRSVWYVHLTLYPRKRRLNFAAFIKKERVNFPAVNLYHVDIITHVNFISRGLSRVRGNLHARFLGEAKAVMPWPYPTVFHTLAAMFYLF